MIEVVVAVWVLFAEEDDEEKIEGRNVVRLKMFDAEGTEEGGGGGGS